MEKPRISQQVSDYLWMTLATVILCVGVYFFRFPNHFTTGGVTGLSVMFAKLWPALSPTTFNNLLNIALLGLGLLFLGKDFGLKTTYFTLLSTGLMWLLEALFPLRAPLTDQPFMELLIAVFLPAIGAAILFNVGASSGGTDIIAMILKKYTHIYNTGSALLLTDFLIACGAFFVFDIKVGIFSVFGLIIRVVMMDSVLSSLNQRKYFHIITADAEPIKAYITHELKRTATVFDGVGAFTGEDRKLIITVVSRRQAVDLRNFVRAQSERNFVLITNTSEIIGKGFRSTT